MPFDESRFKRGVPLDRVRDVFEGPNPVLFQPHPGRPSQLAYQTPVWDALIWRFVNRVAPTTCAQEATNPQPSPPPFAFTFSAPAPPATQQCPVLDAAAAFSTLSLHTPADIADQPVSLSLNTGVPGNNFAFVGEYAAGIGGGDITPGAGCVSSEEGESSEGSGDSLAAARRDAYRSGGPSAYHTGLSDGDGSAPESLDEDGDFDDYFAR